MRYLLVILLLAGCTASRAAREACYAANEAAQAERILRECPDSWEECPARDQIISDLRAAHARCQ